MTPPTSRAPSSSSSAAVSSSASRVWMMTGSPHVAREADLGAEDLALHVAGRVVVVEVEADLPMATIRLSRASPRSSS